MSDNKSRVLVQEVSAATGADQRHLMAEYQTETESDFANRPSMSWADARSAFLKYTAAYERDARIRGAFANEPDRRRAERDAVWHRAAASIPADPAVSEAQRYLLQTQAAARATAAWDAANPEVGSGQPGADRDMYDWSARVGLK